MDGNAVAPEETLYNEEEVEEAPEDRCPSPIETNCELFAPRRLVSLGISSLSLMSAYDIGESELGRSVYLAQRTS